MNFLPLLGLIAVIWLQLFRQLQTDWSLNPQYAYGYLVPFLALGLAWRRWPDRPAIAPGGIGWLAAAFAGAMLLFPLRLVEEANPEWRFALWCHSLTVAGITLGLIGWTAGAGWARHFGFAVFFVLVAVPWPMFLEKALIHGLMRTVAALVVELGGFAGLPGVQHGNVIEIAGGLVGVDEACSGVRSLQTTLMTALFFGELYRMSVGRRLGLMGAGVIFAFIANVFRTWYLVWTASKYGFEALHRVHDAAGIVVMAVVLPALALLAWRLQAPPPTRAREGDGLALPGFSGAVCLLIGGAALSSEVVMEFWYRQHESSGQPNLQWTVQWPSNQYSFAEVALPDTARAVLRCDEGRGVSWIDAQANQWQLFFLKWEPGRNSAQLAKGHNPEICLPSTGWKLARDLGKIDLDTRGLHVPFRQYEFKSGSRTMFVYYCLWQNHRETETSGLLEDGSVTSRWLAVRHGIRHRGQQVLEMALEGPSTPTDAISALKDQVERIVYMN